MTRKSAGVAVALGLWVAATPLTGHHSFAAHYDEANPVTITGQVRKVVWKNPHVVLNIDVPGDGGKVTSWQLEMGSPNGLMQQGWRVDSIKPGDQVTVTGFPAKDGSHVANARKVVLGVQGKTYSVPGDPRPVR